MRRNTILTIAVVATLILAAGSFPRLPPIHAERRSDPPGRLLDVGGFRLHITCSGRGSPTVVIDGGAGTWSIFYAYVQKALSGEARVCTYDRAGLGWSDEGPLPRTSARMAEELHALLHAAGASPPLLLVGHSLGGYNVRVYQQRYPEEVGGIVLVDAAHEAQWERLPPEWADGVRAQGAFWRARAEKAGAGELSEADVRPGAFTAYAPEWRDDHVAAQLTAKPYLGVAHENEGAFQSARETPRGSLGALPLVVLTARRSFEAFAGAGLDIEPANRVWLELQRELVGLSTNAVQVFSERDHGLHGSDPDAIVSAVRRGLSMVRGVPSGPAALGLPTRGLPSRSTPEVDDLLRRMEDAYQSMDAQRFVELFTSDVVQIDVPRRVHVKGRERWLAWTRDVINPAHRRMECVHRGRTVVGPWVTAEVEWSGVVKADALGAAGGGDREYRYTGLVLMRVDRGRIAEQIIYGDQPTLMDHMRPPAP